MKKIYSTKNLFASKIKFNIKRDFSPQSFTSFSNQKTLRKNNSSPLFMKLKEKFKILEILNQFRFQDQFNLSSNHLSSNSKLNYSDRKPVKKKKKAIFYFPKTFPKEEFSSSFDKIPPIIKVNKNLLNDSIYTGENEIKYSKKNLEKLKDYFTNKKVKERRLSILFNNLFEKRKKGEEIKLKQIPFNKISSKTYCSFSEAKNIYSNIQNKRSKRNSENISKLFNEFLQNEDKFEKKLKNNKKNEKEKLNYCFLKNYIKFQNLLKYNLNFRDSVLQDFNVPKSNDDDDNIKDTLILIRKQYNYPKYIKTKFKPKTLIKFSTNQGAYFGTPI